MCLMRYKYLSQSFPCIFDFHPNLHSMIFAYETSILRLLIPSI